MPLSFAQSDAFPKFPLFEPKLTFKNRNRYSANSYRSTLIIRNPLTKNKHRHLQPIQSIYQLALNSALFLPYKVNVWSSSFFFITKKKLKKKTGFMVPALSFFVCSSLIRNTKNSQIPQCNLISKFVVVRYLKLSVAVLFHPFSLNSIFNFASSFEREQRDVPMYFAYTTHFRKCENAISELSAKIFW